MTSDGRHTTGDAGRAEVQRRHHGRVSPQAQARQAVDAAMRELPDTPPRGHEYGPDTPDAKWRTRARNEAHRRYDLPLT